MSPKLTDLEDRAESLRNQALEADNAGDIEGAQAKYAELKEVTTKLVDDHNKTDWEPVNRKCRNRLEDIEEAKEELIDTGETDPSTPDHSPSQSEEDSPQPNTNADADKSQSSGPTAGKYEIWDPDVEFTDVMGLEEPKRVLRNQIKKVIQGSEYVEALDLKPITGVVFYGPPGTGKTYLTKAFASDLGGEMSVLRAKGSQLVSKWVGEPQKNITELFDIARTHEPCLVFIDEIDQVIESRDNDDTPKGHDKMVAQFLEEMSDIGPDDQITVIGATNRPTSLDEAATRPGRFTQAIYVGLPDKMTRLKILRKALEEPQTRHIERRFLNKIAREMDGYSCADVEQVVEEAKFVAAGNDRLYIHPPDLVEGLRRHDSSVDPHKWGPYERGEQEFSI